ncbi:pirin family protein [Halolamina salifodinae]|uniref:Redox-sensitive bicupin YhaK (Pirin superfamily) n=1 Tax=Halolamina salifodinae TaxID=1202767 RepID=A0A8T4GVZ5_9EURY|nr:pirin family protein [Halolamina salifodinae]MBP1987167.1 redox-sensitive bicupin YhaK (pirin superfamily) [Halolamina salifodinae]
MSFDQTVNSPLPGETVRHGTGVNATRAFPTSNYQQNLDPFVLFERFYIDPDDGFPMHPHKGFEIVSYMLEGGMEHEDSLGVTHTAYPGDAMGITTGAGIEHSEMPADGAGCNGLQLWVNLPREQKEVEPDYEDASPEELPTEELDGARVTTVVGEGSPLSLYTEMEYLDVRVDGEWEWTTPEGWSGFLFGVEGEGAVNGDSFGKGDVLPATEAGGVTVEGEVRLVAVAGEPHEEPIQQRGPFVF